MFFLLPHLCGGIKPNAFWNIFSLRTQQAYVLHLCGEFWDEEEMCNFVLISLPFILFNPCHLSLCKLPFMPALRVRMLLSCVHPPDHIPCTKRSSVIKMPLSVTGNLGQPLKIYWSSPSMMRSLFEMYKNNTSGTASIHFACASTTIMITFPHKLICAIHLCSCVSPHCVCKWTFSFWSRSNWWGPGVEKRYWWIAETLLALLKFPHSVFQLPFLVTK